MENISVGRLHALMLDYARQRNLELKSLDVAVWEEFKSLIGVSESAQWLQEEFCLRFLKQELKLPSLDVEGVDGGLNPKLYKWCNDAREGLQQKGIQVQVHLPPLHPDFLDSLSQQAMTDTKAARSKKRTITPMERLIRIKKTLVKQRRRLSVSSNSSG